MARSEFMSVAIVAIVLAVSFKHASALKCWECNWSGTEKNYEFCKDPFQPNASHDWASNKCRTAPGYNIYCRKTIDKVNNSTVYSRGCYQRPANATEETCSDKSPASVVNVECHLCTENGCNSGVQFTSTIAFIATTMLTAYILSA